MKNLKNKFKIIFAIVAIFLVSPILKGQSKIIEMDVSDKVINFSSYCKPGKVTIFEISTPGCRPCETLKKFLEDQNYDTAKVTIYHLVIGKGSATDMWGYEGISVVPVLHFYSPKKNCVKILRPTDKDYSNEKINYIITSLIEYTNVYFKK